MDEKIYERLLYDIYSGLLTAKQQEVMNLYFLYDNSLSEIADSLGLTRQAIYDSVKTSIAQLKNFENKLNILNNRLNESSEIRKIIDEINLVIETKDFKKLQNARKKLEKLLQNGQNG